MSNNLDLENENETLGTYVIKRSKFCLSSGEIDTCIRHVVHALSFLLCRSKEARCVSGQDYFSHQ